MDAMFELYEIKNAEELQRGDLVKIDDRIVRINSIWTENGSVVARGSNAKTESFLATGKVNTYTKAPR